MTTGDRYLGAGKENLVEFQRVNGIQLLFQMLSYLSQGYLSIMDSLPVGSTNLTQSGSQNPALTLVIIL